MNYPKVITLVVGSLKTNCYLIINKCSESIIIDPGDDGEYIIQKITDNALTPRAIFLTHGHYDHVQAAAELQLVYNIPVFLNSKDLFLYEKSPSTVTYFEKTKNTLVSKNIFPYQEKYLQTLKKFLFKVLETPGHTPGSVSIHFPKRKILFVGDLVFSDASLGSCIHKYSNINDLIKSVDYITKLPQDTILYSGHGTPSTIKTLKKLLIE